jgi:hypothetical protein
MTLEGSGPLKLLASFLENNYSETLKTFVGVGPGVVKLLTSIENQVLAYSKGGTQANKAANTPTQSDIDNLPEVDPCE